MSDSGGNSSGDESSSVESQPETRVLVLWENGSATYFLRPGETVKLGRHSDCEIVIDLPSVSRRHACLSGAVPGKVELASVEDIGGMNGVRVRGQRIPTNQPFPVGAGDVIELGGAIVVLHPPRDRLGAPSAGAIARAAAHRVSASEDPMKAVDRLIDVVAQSDLGVLLLGETGVGKTFAAEAIHARSARARGPLMKVDCSALPEAQLEGELFGYEGGELGGEQTKAGLLESAEGGTVLLDEIGEMPLSTQAKLLTVIETREVQRLGATRPRSLDVRFVAATNRDLLTCAIEGVFRLDLYYRLNGISIVIPPLRERTGEILRFATKFLAEAAKRAGRPPPRLSNEALGVLVRHPFLGNFRELRSTMERACVLAGGGFVGPEHLLFETRAARRTEDGSIVGSQGLPKEKTGGGAASKPTSIKPMPAFPVGRRAPIAPTEPPDAPSDPPPDVVVPRAPRPFETITTPPEPFTPVKIPTHATHGAHGAHGAHASPPPPPGSSSPIVAAATPSSPGALREQMTAFERDRIVAALEESNGNQTKAAEALGMSRRALIARIEQYGLPRPRKR